MRALERGRTGRRAGTPSAARTHNLSSIISLGSLDAMREGAAAAEKHASDAAADAAAADADADSAAAAVDDAARALVE